MTPAMITIISNSKGVNENARNSVKAASGVQAHMVERDRWNHSALGDYRSAGGSALHRHPVGRASERSQWSLAQPAHQLEE